MSKTPKTKKVEDVAGESEKYTAREIQRQHDEIAHLRAEILAFLKRLEQLEAENERLRGSLELVIKNCLDWREVRKIASEALADCR